ncbi:PAS domain S-box protein [Natrialbaceae archaeon A-CW3]
MTFWGDADDTEALQHYRTLIETIDDGIYRLDIEGRLVAVNDVILEMTGYTREDVLGKHMSVLFDGDCAMIEREIERLRANATDRSESLELTMGTAEGRQIRCEVRVNTLEEGDSVHGTVGIVRERSEHNDRAGRRQAGANANANTDTVTAEATVRRLFENVPDNYLIVRPEGYEIVAVSDAYLDATMTERAEIIGQSLFEIFPADPDDPADGVSNLRKSLGNVAETGEADVMSVTHYPIPDRESDTGEFEDRWWSPINSPVFTTSGEIEYIIHSVEDITPIIQELHTDGKEELLHVPDAPDSQLTSDIVLRGQEFLQQAKREAFDQLRESEERFRALVTTTSDVVFTTNADWSEMRSLEGAEFLVGTDEQRSSWVERYIPPEDQQRVREAIDDAIRTKSSFELEHQIRREDDTVAWVATHATPLLDDDGDITQWLGAANDVTERVERERELEHTKERLEAAAEAGAVGTWEWHISDDRMVTGESFARKFGIDPVAATEGVSLDEFVSAIHDDDRERVKRKVEDAIESGAEYEEEYRVWDTNDELRWVVARGHVEYDEDGNPVTFPGALADITERKQFEQMLEESNERLEQFAYAASHDLQEPLRMVTSYLHLLERRYADELDEDGDEFIEFAVDGANRMRDMIEGLLEYSRVESRGDPFESVDLNTVLQDALTDLQMKSTETDAEITDDDLPTVRGDPDQLRQVFQNLLDNALEYSGDEPPRVHVSVERRGLEWVITIRDEGVGIDPEEAGQIFEVFQRLHSREEHEGTGIGLALCERIVERHGGTIWVESQPGEGSTFSFTLPVTNNDER